MIYSLRLIIMCSGTTHVHQAHITHIDFDFKLYFNEHHPLPHFRCSHWLKKKIFFKKIPAQKKTENAFISGADMFWHDINKDNCLKRRHDKASFRWLFGYIFKLYMQWERWLPFMLKMSSSGCHRSALRWTACIVSCTNGLVLFKRKLILWVTRPDPLWAIQVSVYIFFHVINQG